MIGQKEFFSSDLFGTASVLCVLGYLFSGYSKALLWLVFECLGIREYRICDREAYTRLQRLVGKRSVSRTIDDKPQGWGYGKCFVCYIAPVVDPRFAVFDAHIWCTQAIYRQLYSSLVGHSIASCKHTSASSDKKINAIDVWHTIGSLSHVFYRHRNVIIPVLHPSVDQEAVILQTCRVFQEKQFCVCHLWGSPGTGKSMTALMLCQKLGGCYINTFQPWTPGQSLWTLYSEVRPSKTKPLVIAMDDVDDVLRSFCYEKKTFTHKDLPIETQDRQSWNRFLDNFEKNMYPFVVLVLTTNSRAEVNPRTLDDERYESVLRNGRVHVRHRFTYSFITS